MKIIKHAKGSGDWVEATINDLWLIAKVFKHPSDFGIDNGHVSKLSVCTGSEWDHENVLINYDRGWDTGSNRPEVGLIVDQLNRYAKTLTVIEDGYS